MGPALTNYLSIFILLFAFNVNGMAHAGSNEQEQQVVAGIVLFATGQREQLNAAGQKSLLKRGDNVFVGDKIHTGADGHLQLRMVDDAYLSVKPNSKLSILAYTHSPENPDSERVKIHLEKGVARSVTGNIGKRNKENYRFNTPVAAIGVRGTDFSVYTTDQISKVAVSQGGIAISPYTHSCNENGFGACSGKQVRELFAEQSDRYLELRKGEDSADILEGRLESLMPVLEEIFKFSVINTKQESGTAAPLKSYALSDEVQAQLADALDREESLLNQNGDQLDTNAHGPGLKADPDGDGIATILEERWLMNPAKADSDGDGLDDLAELWAHTDPLQSDTDQDGVADGVDALPLQRDQFTIGEQRISLQDISGLQVLPETSMQQVQGDLWRMNIVLQGAEQIDLNIAFDATSSSWWGEPDSLSVLNQLMLTNAWVDIQKYWALNGLVYGGLSNSTVSELVAQWQKAPEVVLGGSDLGLLLNPSDNIFTNKTVTYQSSYQSSLTGEAAVSLQSLTVDAVTQQFQAVLIDADGEEIYLLGRAENGLLSGRAGDYKLQGTFVDAVNLAVVVNGPEVSFVTHLDFGQLENYQIAPVLQVDSATNWGRWSNYAALTAEDLIALQTEQRPVLANRHFTLIHEVDNEFVMPETGQYSFQLDHYDAVYVDHGEIQPARVESASLNIAIPQNRFSMHMGVTASGLQGVEALRSFGEIDQLGQMRSDDILSDTEVDGFLGESANDAGLLFEKVISDDGYISGASYWKRVN
ncbi:MAG: FecR family protein [Neptuniibacter sp.]